MEKRRRNVKLGLIAGLIIGLYSSCSVEQEIHGIAHIRTSFDLKSHAAMDGKVTITDAYLKLDRIQIAGSLGGQSNTNLTHSISTEEPPYQLTRNADSAEVNIPVSALAYDALDLHLYLFQDNYSLVFRGEDKTEEPVPVDEPPVNAGGDGTGGNNDGGTGGGSDSGDGSGAGQHDQDDKDQEENEAPDPGQHHDDDRDNDDDDDKANGDDDRDDDYDGNGDDDGDEDDGKGGNKGDKDKGKDEDRDHDKDKGKGHDKDKDHKKHKNKGKHHDDDDDRDDDDDDDDNDDDDDRDDDDDWNDDDDDRDDDDDEDGRKSGNDNSQAVDLDHFFQNAKPGLVVFAVYENNGAKINLIFAATGVEKFTVRGRQDDRSTIVLAERNSGTVTFDPDQWFRSVTAAQIESGEKQIYQQQTVLFIHPEHNTALYQALIAEIERSSAFDIDIAVEGNL